MEDLWIYVIASNFKSTSICCIRTYNIVQRPVVIDGNVEVRPVMYLALSYDHRIIDGERSKFRF